MRGLPATLLATVLCAAPAAQAAGPGDILAARGDPLNSPEQVRAELLADAVFATPAVQAGMEALGKKWQDSVQPLSPESQDSFADALRELGFSSTLRAFYLDPTRPELLRVEANAHKRFGIPIPGGLFILNNPDTIYYFTQLDAASSYVMTGYRASVAPADTNFSVLDSTETTVSNIDNDSLVTTPDGSFTITIDATPANGRPNHLQLPAGASRMFARNILTDWAAQRPDTLTLTRVAGPAAAPPRTVETLQAQALAVAQGALGFILGIDATIGETPVNVLQQPVIRNTGGFLATQSNSFGHFLLNDDEACVFTFRTGGAAYVNLAAYNFWQVQPDWHFHTSTLNNAQAQPNPDGTYTFVLSVKDPGVYNWIDPVGQHDVIAEPRWQGLPTVTPASGGPAVVSQAVVPLSRLRQAVPPGTVFVTPEQRLRQQQERARSIAWRDDPG